MIGRVKAQAGKKKPPNPPKGRGGSRDRKSVAENRPVRRRALTHGTPTLARTVVFVDYQNMYRSAREAFGWQTKPGHFGSFRPYSLGKQLARGGTRALTEVRVYTGIHGPRRNAVQHGQMQRRMLAWVAAAPDKVQVFPRSLRYDANGKAREKGVDVELAIDIVSLAIDGTFDVMAVASTDTDLVPALQFVADRFPNKKIVTVTYEPAEGCHAAAPLDLPRRHVERRFITARDFASIADKTNYYASASDKSALIDPTRVARIRRRFGA
jgi:uncharacterized LabA/DUF88 family protein